MPKRYARFSAVCPISSPTIGSVRPFMRPITGARYAGLNLVTSAARWPAVFAAYQLDSQCTIASENSSGARDSASTPPASTSSERPVRMLAIAESSACMPDAQLRITVQPGTLRPQPIRSATTRPMLTSSGDGAAQPRITSSRSDGAKGCRTSSARPASVARSDAANGPGRLRAFRNGVRAPSTMKIGSLMQQPCARPATTARRAASDRRAPRASRPHRGPARSRRRG